MFIIDLNTSQILENAEKSQYIKVTSVKSNLLYNAEIYALKELPSTNTLLKLMAEAGAEDKTVIIADKQTAGRGRAGKSFYSPNRSGIYMSALIRKAIKTDELGYITPAVALSVSKALSFYGFDAKIKWVNDIFISDKKVCGILTESSLNNCATHSDYIVIGIGLNLESPESGFPQDIKSIATALFDVCNDQLKNKIISDILNCLFEIIDTFDVDKIIADYKARSYLNGKNIVITQGDSSYSAKVLCLDDKLNLVVKTENGEQISINFGDVSIAAE